MRYAAGWRSRVALGVPAALALLLLVVPLVALLVRADWARIPSDLATPTVLPALRLSLTTTSVTAVLCLVLGTPLAWFLARSEHRATSWVRALLTVPLVLPPVVGGVALLMAWGRNGVIGQHLAPFGIQIPFTTVAVVLAETFVAMPYYVLAVEGAMRGLDPRLESVARTLGASDLRYLRTVGIPLVLPGIASGLALAWARALGEFGATITFAGNFQGRTQTLPLLVYVELERDPQVAISISIMLLGVSVLVLGVLRGTVAAMRPSADGGHGVAGLDARVRLSRGAIEVDVSLTAAPGQVIGVLGPNGGGKTTTVLALAGVLPLAEGHVRVGGDVWDDGRRRLAPEQRRVGLMLADSLLFPHLRAVDNVAYGPRSRGIDRHRSRERACLELERVGLGDRAASRPHELSSGQQARVALARALATDPALLLLDEPLAALDPDTRARTRSDLAARLTAYDGVTVLVTHDPLDALTLADHLVFIEDGRVTQTGTPAEVLSEPRSAYVGTVVGLNLYAAQGDSHGHVHTADWRAHRHDEPDRGGGVGHDPAERRVAAPARTGGFAAQRVEAAHRLRDDAGPVGAGGTRRGRAAHRRGDARVGHRARAAGRAGRLGRGQGDRGPHLPPLRTPRPPEQVETLTRRELTR